MISIRNMLTRAELMDSKDKGNNCSGAQEEKPSHEQGAKKVKLASHFSTATFNTRRQGNLVFKGVCVGRGGAENITPSEVVQIYRQHGKDQGKTAPSGCLWKKKKKNYSAMKSS